MNNTLKTRSITVFCFFCLLYGIVVVNLYFIQILHSPYYVKLGEKQHNVTLTCPAPRALVLDRHGMPLALNKESCAAFLVPSQLEDEKKVLEFLHHHFPEAYARFAAHKKTHFFYIKRRLSKIEIELIEKSNIPDIKILHEPSRYYPNHTAATIVGITDIDNNGLFGVEFQYNQQLTGTAATYTLERDARSGRFHFNKEVQTAGQENANVTLTIDSTLQFLVHEEVAHTMEKYDAQEGAAIVMDPLTGDILAMVSLPTFNPEETRALDMQRTKNKVVTDAYELGSVVKILAAIAAFEEGVVTPDELIDCKNVATTYVDGRKINTVKSSVRGLISFAEVIAVSNNIGIALIAKRLQEKLYDHYVRMGIGQKTTIEFPGEHKGFVNPPNAWSKQSIISLSYGYEVSFTLLQLACIFSMIAQDGYHVDPHLIMENNRKHSHMQLYSADTMRTIQALLERTTLEGTAKKAAIKGYKVMSKTGTANMLINGQYVQDKNLFTCASIVQKGDYQRVIVSFIKECKGNNLYASIVAAPLNEAIAQKVLINEKII